jgi:nucleotide-binding universal stress UspA family protein
MQENETAVRPRIVVGVDGSPESKQALRWAAQLAGLTGANIDVVTAWQYPVSFGWAAVPYDGSFSPDVEKALVAAVDEVFGERRPTNVALTVREGNATAVLLAESKGALMLVVGSRGHGGFAGLMLGSVSAHVAEHAHVPVLVVHGDQLFPGVSS